MKRLVYNPKVNAWVKTDDGIVDLSAHITAGSVNRKIGQVSSATLQFRNPKKQNGHMLFTEHERPDGTLGPMLHPMDPIIITLTRLHARPIQVFTGYCDTTPYFELFPGTVQLEASCTLKRLQYTFWDPGLYFVQSFLKEYGWTADLAQGGISKPQAQTQDLKDLKSFNDGSIGALLYGVLTNIGGWDENSIYIESLPKGIGPLVANLSQQFQAGAKENHVVQAQFEDFLTQLIGADGHGSGGPAGTGPIGNYNGPLDRVFPAHTLNDTAGHIQLSAKQVGMLADRAGLPATMVPIAKRESQFFPGIVQIDPGDGNVGYGLWQITPKAAFPNHNSPEYRLFLQLGGERGMRNPWHNAQMARKMYDSGGLGPWAATR